jgi:hypothetical protein
MELEQTIFVGFHGTPTRSPGSRVVVAPKFPGGTPCRKMVPKMGTAERERFVDPTGVACLWDGRRDGERRRNAPAA